MGRRPAVGDVGWWARGIFTHLAGVQRRVQSSGEQPCRLVTPLETRGVNRAPGEPGGQLIAPSSALGSSALHHTGNRTGVVLLRVVLG